MNTVKPSRSKWLILLLRCIGTVDAIALIAVLAPRDAISYIHQMLGMGDFPAEPIAGYLARCTSIWYASYGLLLWFVSFDVAKYSALITFIACAMLVQGLFVIGIDVAEQMPGWWIALEGPCCSGLGAIILYLQWTANLPVVENSPEIRQGIHQ